MIKLSNRQIEDARQAGGINLLIPWQDSFGPVVTVPLNEYRDAAVELNRAVRACLKASCLEHKLAILDVAMTAASQARQTCVYAAAHVVGEDYADATERTLKVGQTTFVVTKTQ